MKCPFSNKKLVLFISFLCLAFVLGIGFHRCHERSPSNLAASGTPLLGGPLLPPFSLKEETGNVFNNSNLKGHYSFLFFGYTHCQGICPLTMTLLTQLYSELEASKTILPQIIFLTLDPKRDTPKVIRRYVKAFNPTFKGVTGPLKSIQQLSQRMGVVYMQAQANPSDTQDYQIDHSGTLYLINPKGQLSAVFSPPLDRDGIRRSYESLVRGKK